MSHLWINLPDRYIPTFSPENENVPMKWWSVLCVVLLCCCSCSVKWIRKIFFIRRCGAGYGYGKKCDWQSSASCAGNGRGIDQATAKAQIWRFPQMGIPKNGWFLKENPIKNGMMTGGTPILGHLHLGQMMVSPQQCIHRMFHELHIFHTDKIQKSLVHMKRHFLERNNLLRLVESLRFVPRPTSYVWSFWKGALGGFTVRQETMGDVHSISGVNGWK